jgi:hypothetical protein
VSINPEKVLDSIEWIVENGERPTVINMSLGGYENFSPYLYFFDQAVNDAVSLGIPVVVSAANGNTDASHYSPARVAAAITVGAVDSSDTRESSSNYGSSIDVWAPGDGIPAAWIGSDDATTSTFGMTSAAAPHVTGVVALLMEKHRWWSSAQVHSAIVDFASSVTIGSAGSGSPNRLVNSGFVNNDVMLPGERLYSDQQVTSLDGAYHFYYQADGNLVLYNANWSWVWASNTAGTVPGYVEMQTDGNLVVYDAYGVPRFASGTDGHSGSRLTVDTGGTVRITDQDVVWVRPQQ